MRNFPLSYWKSGVVPFSPNQISNLVLWLDASSPTTINAGSPVDGDQVSSWTDKSTNAVSYTQATSGKQPLYKTNIVNGKSAMLFANASGQLLKEAATTLISTGTGFTSFFVAKLTAFSQPYMYGYCFKQATSAVSPSFGYSSNAAYKDAFFGCDTGGITWKVFRGTTLSNPTTTWNYVEVNYNGSGATTIGNFNMNFDTAAATLTSASSNDGATSNVIGSGFQLGTDTYSWNGYIAEWIVYNKLISAGERTNMQAYFLSKYGI